MAPAREPWLSDPRGADTAQLLEQARALRTGDERVTAVREALETTVAAAAWTGPDAADFRETRRACSAQPS